ncbi:MAG: DUF6334 family protein [Nakamurella sp.]
MDELMKRVVDGFGALISLAGGSVDPVDPAFPARFDQYEFAFEHGYLTVSAAADDDTVRLTTGRMTLPYAVQLTDSAPWSAAVGSGVMWIWTLQNQNGYQDGVQVQFGWSSGNVTAQLMCMASGVITSRVLELDGQLLTHHNGAGNRPAH